MIARLGLEKWFCAYCGQPIRQPVTGRRRKTCSDRCRHGLWIERRHRVPPVYA
jgi:predicted nucleic acid-binding Zn ribbon protein